jgi:hypothetical protein
METVMADNIMKRIGDVVVGDRLLGVDGTERNVTQVMQSVMAKTHSEPDNGRFQTNWKKVKCCDLLPKT